MDRSLWDIAIEQASRSKGNENSLSESEESTVILVGSKNSGKTSILLRYADRDEPPKPTVALEYTHAKKPKGVTIAKDVGHIWELGGGTWLTKLIDIPINPNILLNTTLILVLDLSAPAELWTTMETLLKAAESRVKEAIREAQAVDPQIEKKLKKKAMERVGEDHPDKDELRPFLLPLVIIGSKYDIFQDFDSEKRKNICKTLRYVAHVYGATLQFFSIKHDQLVTKLKSLLTYCLFNKDFSKANQVDHNKPIFVYPGQDTKKQIGPPPLSESDIGKYKPEDTISLWKNAFTKLFPQTSVNNPAAIDDPGKDPQYAEPDIDTLRTQKDEELERYRKLAERKARDVEQNGYIIA
ncbi:cytoplasmic dynein 2 light intermediate chain 1-like [Physella acuta]|uniref:cytoplasmic dynein 2 light intermediate chain 1-like n=1 Tax=Physella acuta TaxID=109671 RepID=UPI0027DB9135|nr:cytoplasmic dynein 2 light intermediate chain 1-like [Physella acuta]